ncbi:unnamed protein product [Closterium sp. NIES-64]|nr:unnamed protein product [Closterium sp. NIES-64]
MASLCGSRGSSGGSGGGSGSGGGGSSGSLGGATRWGVFGGRQIQLQRRPRETLTPLQLREWYAQSRGSQSTARCPFRVRCSRAGESAALGAGKAAALGASESAPPGTGESALSGTAPAEALHTFTLDSSASRSFFRDNTTLTPLSRSDAVSLADPTGGPVLAHSSTVLPCPAVPSDSLSGLHLPSFSTNMVSGADLQDAWVDQFTPGGQRVTHSTCSRTGRHLATVLPPLPPSPAPPCLPYVEGRQCTATHSSSFPPTTAPLKTLHMDVWGPARVSGQDRERYFLLVVDDYTRYTTVFPLCTKGEVPDVLIPWIRTARLQLRERFEMDFPVLRLHSDRGLLPPTSRRVLPSQDITLDEPVPFYRLFPYRTASLPPPSLFLAPSPPPVDPLSPQGPAPSGVSQEDAVEPVEVAVDSGAATGGGAAGGAEPEHAEPGGPEPGVAESEGAEHGGAEPERAEPGGAEPEHVESGDAESEGAEPWGAEPRGAEPGGAESEGAEPAVAKTGGAYEVLLELELLEVLLMLEMLELEVLPELELLDVLLVLVLLEVLEPLVREVLVLEVLELVGLPELELEALVLLLLELLEVLELVVLRELELQTLELGY